MPFQILDSQSTDPPFVVLLSVVRPSGPLGALGHFVVQILKSKTQHAGFDGCIKHSTMSRRKTCMSSAHLPQQLLLLRHLKIGASLSAV